MSLIREIGGIQERQPRESIVSDCCGTLFVDRNTPRVLVRREIKGNGEESKHHDHDVAGNTHTKC